MEIYLNHRWSKDMVNKLYFDFYVDVISYPSSKPVVWSVNRHWQIVNMEYIK